MNASVTFRETCRIRTENIDCLRNPDGIRSVHSRISAIGTID